MNKILAVASGKGGVGKSTICCHLGKTLSDKGKKTVLIETDVGLRGLDIFFGIKNIIYDLGDLFKERCSLKEVLKKTPYSNNLYLIPAPFDFDIKMKHENFEKLFYLLNKNFDKIIIDLKAGVDVAVEIKDMVDMFLIVVTPDLVCVRDAAFFINFLKINKEEKPEVRLIINKITKQFRKRSHFENLDDIIDEIKLQLIGAIPKNNKIEIFTQLGKNLKSSSKPYKIFSAISSRLEDCYEKLIL